jgi:TolA-binding protein
MNATKMTVIKNGKDISNTDEGKNIAEKIKEIFRVKLPNLFSSIWGKVDNDGDKNKQEQPKSAEDEPKEDTKKTDDKDAKIKELEKKVEELSAKLEEKNLEDQKKDEPEINESKKDVEISEEPVLEEHTDDKQPAETVEDKDDQNPSIKQPVIAPVSETVQDVKGKITEEKQMAKELIKQGKKLLSNNPSGPINDTAKDSKNVINAVEGASQLLK